MSLRFFEGPAGSGKTTCVFEELERVLEARPLEDGERVLGLTKMHGSRRRVHRRLDELPLLRGRFHCTTVDSFAWRVVRRWRSLARTRGELELAEDDYELVCRLAGTLLAEEISQLWVTRAFPVLVIDEMQDSKGGQLEIVRSLSASGRCIAAADDFQDLEATGENDAVAWARESGETESLTQVHRTSAAGLLDAAAALRRGFEVPENGGGFTVLGAQNKDVGASFVSRNLTWWRRRGDVAVITPVRPENSRFVRDLIARVEEKPIGKGAFGPHRIPWETSQEEDCSLFLVELGIPENPSAEMSAVAISPAKAGGSGPAHGLCAWLDQQRRVAGRTKFLAQEVRAQARRIHRRSRAYRRVRERGIRAMTIHQAKNREFDSVIVLWPYEVVREPERQRRLLYNAVTRAKRQALVVVQNPTRLGAPPFARG